MTVTTIVLNTNNKISKYNENKIAYVLFILKDFE